MNSWASKMLLKSCLHLCWLLMADSKCVSRQYTLQNLSLHYMSTLLLPINSDWIEFPPPPFYSPATSLQCCLIKTSRGLCHPFHHWIYHRHGIYRDDADFIDEKNRGIPWIITCIWRTIKSHKPFCLCQCLKKQRAQDACCGQNTAGQVEEGLIAAVGSLFLNHYFNRHLSFPYSHIPLRKDMF